MLSVEWPEVVISQMKLQESPGVARNRLGVVVQAVSERESSTGRRTADETR